MRTRTDAASTGTLEERWMASLSYVCILIPLFSERRLTAFERFHAKQGMKLLLAAVAANALGLLSPDALRFGVLTIVNGAALSYMLLGMTYAATGTAKSLPLLSRRR